MTIVNQPTDSPLSRIIRGTDEFSVLERAYGKDLVDSARSLINDMAPVTRRDSWWGTASPYEMIIMFLLNERKKTVA